MTSDVIQLRPEVLEIVREIAARPDSVLLRVPRGSEMRTLREDSALASPTSSALSVAERHLVAVHREEVAYVLRCAAWRKLTLQDSGEDHIMLQQTASEAASRIRAEDIAAQAAEVARAAGTLRVGQEAHDLLAICVKSPRGMELGVAQLCASAQRLAPTYQGRHMVAASYLLEGRHEAAIELASDALRVAPDSKALGLTWTLFAELGSLKGIGRQVEFAAREAIRAYPNLLSPRLALILASVRHADFVAASSAVVELADVLHPNPGALDEYITRLERIAPRIRTSLDRSARACLARLARVSDPLAERLFHALL